MINLRTSIQFVNNPELVVSWIHSRTVSSCLKLAYNWNIVEKGTEVSLKGVPGFRDSRLVNRKEFRLAFGM